MKLKFRYHIPSNGITIYSKDFKNLAEFFNIYQAAVDSGNNPTLEMVIHTSYLGTEYWKKCE